MSKVLNRRIFLSGALGIAGSHAFADDNPINVDLLRALAERLERGGDTSDLWGGGIGNPLFTAFHTEIYRDLAFIRQNETDLSYLGSMEVIVVETDDVSWLNMDEWTMAFEMQQSVPLFVNDGSSLSSLGLTDVRDLMNGQLSDAGFDCCVHGADQNFQSHVQFYANRFDLDPGDVTATLQAMTGEARSYDELGQMLATQIGGTDLLAIGLRGVGPETQIRPVAIEGLLPGQGGYPLTVNSRVYVRSGSERAATLLGSMIQGEMDWMENDLRMLQLHSDQ